jgi:hypothetical protein
MTHFSTEEDASFENSDTSNIRKKRTRWNHSTVRAEALKYEVKKRFSIGSRGAFDYAKRHGILMEITAHMKTVCIQWTHATVAEEALKYQLKSHFREHAPGALGYAKKHGIYEEICSHMPQQVRKGAT